jgi:hypothetical protein
MYQFPWSPCQCDCDLHGVALGNHCHILGSAGSDGYPLVRFSPLPALMRGKALFPTNTLLNPNVEKTTCKCQGHLGLTQLTVNVVPQWAVSGCDYEQTFIPTLGHFSCEPTSRIKATALGKAFSMLDYNAKLYLNEKL